MTSVSPCATTHHHNATSFNLQKDIHHKVLNQVALLQGNDHRVLNRGTLRGMTSVSPCATTHHHNATSFNLQKDIHHKVLNPGTPSVVSTVHRAEVMVVHLTDPKTLCLITLTATKSHIFLVLLLLRVLRCTPLMLHPSSILRLALKPCLNYNQKFLSLHVPHQTASKD